MSSAKQLVQTGANTSNLRVLIVDAEPGSATLLSGLLRRHFEIIECRSAQEAKELFESNPDIAIVVATHLAEELDALELLEYLHHKAPQCKRVLISSPLDSTQLLRCINDLGVHHVSMHPIVPSVLIPALKGLAGDYWESREAAKFSAASNKRLASKDRLTGLYNHRSFQERFLEELARARRHSHEISLLHLDLDHFSSVNRGAGFRCGDEILQEIANILCSKDENARQSDIVARFGGQEFTLLLPETSKEGASTRAERIRTAVASAKLPGGVSTTASVGVATFPEDGTTAEDIFHGAYAALLRAKEEGRNRIVMYGNDPDKMRSLDLPNVHTKTFPTFHDRMGDLVYALERDRAMSCLYVDLSRLRRIEQEFGIAQHSQLLARAGQILSQMHGDTLRKEDLLCRTDDADGFLCFVSPPRVEESPPVNLQEMIKRVADTLETGLTEVMRGLTRDRPQVAVGMGRVLNNSMIRTERLVHRLVEETKLSAELEWQRLSRIHKVELQDLIIGRRLRTAYQPLVDLDTGDRFAFEALTRGPTDSALAMPTTLFSVADAVDLTMELDRACFTTAIRNAKNCGPTHRLFLNLLPASFYDAHFIENKVVAMLDEIGLTPANLVFEITERLAIENFSAFRQALRRCTDIGFGVAVDDVGTRHSNLEAVMALQPHFIKLSEILCRGVTKSTVKREMVRSLVHIAGTIDAVTVAEGIEDLEDLMTLRDLGIRFGQGYYLARPDTCFPTVSQDAMDAIAARPQRRAAGSLTEPLIRPDRGNTAQGSSAGMPIPASPQLPLEVLESSGRTRSPGKTATRLRDSIRQSDDGFEDEPTRTRGQMDSTV